MSGETLQTGYDAKPCIPADRREIAALPISEREWPWHYRGPDSRWSR